MRSAELCFFFPPLMVELPKIKQNPCMVLQLPALFTKIRWVLVKLVLNQGVFVNIDFIVSESAGFFSCLQGLPHQILHRKNPDLIWGKTWIFSGVRKLCIAVFRIFLLVLLGGGVLHSFFWLERPCFIQKTESLNLGVSILGILRHTIILLSMMLVRKILVLPGCMSLRVINQHKGPI